MLSDLRYRASGGSAPSHHFFALFQPTCMRRSAQLCRAMQLFFNIKTTGGRLYRRLQPTPVQTALYNHPPLL